MSRGLALGVGALALSRRRRPPVHPSAVVASAETISGSAQARAKPWRRRLISRPSTRSPIHSATGASQPGWQVKV